jgi:hypothetical protein
MACAGVNKEMGGNTPKASQVKKKIFLGTFQLEGSLRLAI